MTAMLLHGDCRTILTTLPEQSVQTVVTSPPYYGLRDYGVEGQIGLEPTPAEYVETLVGVFRAVWRVLRDDGVLWLNLGDSYNSGSNFNHDRSGIGGGVRYSEPNQHSRKVLTTLRSKNLIGIPWRVAFALQDDGWILRSEIIWHKPNCMPESVSDRPTRSHEHLFLFAKEERYYYDAESVAESASESSQARAYLGKRPVSQHHVTMQEQGMHGKSDSLRVYDRATRNRRTVWTIPSTPGGKGVHFAVFPEALVEPCILAGSRPGDTVLDPFGGSGTTARVAERLSRDAILIDLNADYIELQEKRTNGVQKALLL